MASVALAVPSMSTRQAKLKRRDVAIRQSTSYVNVRYPLKNFAQSGCNLFGGCAIKRCSFRTGWLRLRGWKCGAAPSPSPFPIPAIPSPSTSPFAIVLVSCSLDVGINLDFECTCNDGQDNEYVTTVDASAYLDVTVPKAALRAVWMARCGHHALFRFRATCS